MYEGDSGSGSGFQTETFAHVTETRAGRFFLRLTTYPRRVLAVGLIVLLVDGRDRVRGDGKRGVHAADAFLRLVRLDRRRGGLRIMDSIAFLSRACALILAAVAPIAFAQSDGDEAAPSWFKQFEERADFSGALSLEWALQLSDGNTQKAEGVFEPELRVRLPKDMDLTAIARLRGDAFDRLEAGAPPQPEVSWPSRRVLIGDRVDAELREFYVATTVGETWLTIGKQQVVWGEADGLKVLDVVNPQDFREFIFAEFEDSRIPLWTVNAEFPIKELTLQLLWIPDLTYHHFPPAGSTFSLIEGLFPPTPGVTFDIREVDRPTNPIADSDVGARLSTFWNGWDLTLNYMYHYDDIPIFFRTVSLPTITVTPEYKRTHLVGGTFSNSFGSMTLRGEVGYSFDKFNSTTDLTDVDGVAESDEFSYVIGLDWFGISETFLSAQLFQSFLTDDAPGLVRDRVETNVSFIVQRDFRNDTVVGETIWVHNTNDGDGFVRPKVSYDVQDNLEVWAGFDVVYGASGGLFGQFSERDRFVLGMEWGF